MRLLRSATWLGAAATVILLARPAWQPDPVKALWAGDLAWLAAVIPGAAIALAWWTGGVVRRVIAGAAMVATMALAARIPATADAVVLIALPSLAALRRAPPSLLDEAWVGGAGILHLLAQLILPLAAPGIVYGTLLCFAPPGSARLIAAALPLALP